MLRIRIIPIEPISIVIVNWNLRDDTLACLRSLFQAGAEKGRVVVVDNASQDGSVAAIRAEFGAGVLLIESGENLGLSGGINLGAKAALESGAEWILLLNNDTEVEPGLFLEFEAAAAALPDVDIWGPQIFYNADRERIWFLGERRIGGSLLGRRVNRSERFDPALAAPLEVDFISGCAMLVRREAFERTGGFDPTFFLFAEEVDFCHRAAGAGFRLAAAPRAHVYHKVSLSTGRDRPKSRFFRVRNQIWFYRRYAGFGQRIFLGFFTAARTLKLAFGDVIRGRFDLIGPAFAGWFGGWFTSKSVFSRSA